MEPLYLEPDEEITSVIDKLSRTSDGRVAVVVPKNSTLFQSLVNLKLLAKEGRSLNKEVVLITANRVGQRLAAQVGIPTYATLGPARENVSEPKVEPSLPTPAQANLEDEETLPDGTKVHHYTPAIGNQPVAIDPVTRKTETEPTVPSSEVPVLPVVNEAPEELSADSAPEVVADESGDQEPVIPEVPTPKITHDEQPTPVASDLPPVITRGGSFRPQGGFALPWKSLLAAAILLLISFSIVYLFLPRAKITLNLPADPVEETLILNARTSPDAAEDVIAGNLINSEKSSTKTVTATGKKDIGTKASGTITLLNKANSSAVALAAGTQLTTGGKNYQLDKAVSIPGASVANGTIVAGETKAAVTASVAGETYNVTNAQFSIANQPSQIYGTGSVAGGTTKQVTVLSQEDLDKAYADLEKELSAAAEEELKTKLEGQTIIEATTKVEVKEKSSDKAVGTQVDSASISMKIDAWVIAINHQQALDKLEAALTKKIKEDQTLFIPAESKPTLTFKEYASDRSSLKFELAGQGYGVQKIDRAAVSQKINHQSKNKALQLLKDEYKTEAIDITITPAWWLDRLPLLSQAIQVDYGVDQTTKAETAEEVTE